MSHRTFDDPHGTSDRARQGLLDNRCEHGPKRHRTKGRRKRLSVKKKAKVKHAKTVRMVAFRRWKSKVQAYWSGESDVHPPNSR